MSAPTAKQEYSSLVRNDGVHRRVYRDPAVFDAEMENIFKNTWVYLAHESQIPTVGDYLTLPVGREPVILVRSEDETIRALVNRCRHRAALVCEFANGNAKSFRCQYHGWTYANDGSLVGVPIPDRQEENFRERLGLVEMPRVESYRGLIFGSFRDDVPSLVDHLGEGVIFYIDRFLDQAGGRPLTAHRHAHRVDMVGNWKFQMENGLDGYHAGFTHRSFFNVMQERLKKNVRYASSLSTASARSYPNGHSVIDPGTTSTQPLVDRLSTLPNATGLFDQLREEVGDDAFDSYLEQVAGHGINVGVFPNLQLIGIHIRRIEPVAVDRTVVSVRPLIESGGPEAFNQMRLRYHELFYGPAGFGQPDDFEMFERVERGIDDSSAEWLLFERGLNREDVTNGNGAELVGAVSDETPQRAQYASWAHLMEIGAGK